MPILVSDILMKSVKVKVVFAVVKQQLQRKSRKNSEASTGFPPMASAILVRYWCDAGAMLVRCWCDAGAMLCHLSYEASLEAGQGRESFFSGLSL